MSINLSRRRRRAVLTAVTAVAVVVPAGILTTGWAAATDSMTAATARDPGISPQAAALRADAEIAAGALEEDLPGDWARRTAAPGSTRPPASWSSPPPTRPRRRWSPAPGPSRAWSGAACSTWRRTGPSSTRRRLRPLRPSWTVHAGDRIALTLDGARCSIGFGVTRGFLTGAYCSASSHQVRSADGRPLGKIRWNQGPPEDDFALVETEPPWEPSFWVRKETSRTLVTGSQEVPIGASVCHSSVQWGWRCGEILQKQVTILSVHQGQTVQGMTHTSACGGEWSDGGPFLTGTQAQGLFSRRDGTCAEGGTSWFQPVDEALARHGLRLLTARSVVEALRCDSGLSQVRCTAIVTGDPPETVRWRIGGALRPAWDGLLTVGGACVPGVPISVTTTSRFGTHAAMWNACRTEPWLS